MQSLNSLKKEVLVLEKSLFEDLALRIFHFQAKKNLIYQKYLKLVSNNYSAISSIEDIPFMPIDFFKKHQIKSGNWKSEKQFLSSATTGTVRSVHEVEDVSFYHAISSRIFEQNYQEIKNTAFLALLPSYLEQGNSSLVEMLKYFISESEQGNSDFYLHNYKELIENIYDLKKKNIPTVLFGVTYALLDLMEQYDVNFSDITVIETGGMKGRREELSKEALHKLLSAGLKVRHVHSEYGMTELLSQAYSKSDGVFNSPISMRILIRDINDPYTYLSERKTGGVNIIDLANVHSCSFIETKDIGVKLEGEKFKILGRFDNSDIRGCNLLVS